MSYERGPWMDAERLIRVSRHALAGSGEPLDVIAEAWQAQALAQAIGNRLAHSGPPELRGEARELGEAGGRGCDGDLPERPVEATPPATGAGGVLEGAGAVALEAAEGAGEAGAGAGTGEGTAAPEVWLDTEWRGPSPMTGMEGIRAGRLSGVADARGALAALADLLGEVGIALVAVACATDDEGLYWQCIEAIDAADESGDRVGGLLRRLLAQERERERKGERERHRDAERERRRRTRPAG